MHAALFNTIAVTMELWDLSALNNYKFGRLVSHTFSRTLEFFLEFCLKYGNTKRFRLDLKNVHILDLKNGNEK